MPVRRNLCLKIRKCKYIEGPGPPPENIRGPCPPGSYSPAQYNIVRILSM